MNRAFLYGDLLFETVRVSGQTVHYAELHFNRLMQGAKQLKFETDLTREQFETGCLAAAAKIGESARVRFVLHRATDGFYIPATNRAVFFTEAHELNTEWKSYQTIGIYEDWKKQCSLIANLKTGNALLYVMAGTFCRESGFDDVLILNEHGRVCEAVSSNVFIVHEGIVYTPALAEGCVAGVMRRVVIDTLTAQKIKVTEGQLHLSALQEASEIFFSNAIGKVIPLLTYCGRMLQTNLSTQLLHSVS